jgi:hypothetical protein
VYSLGQYEFSFHKNVSMIWRSPPTCLISCDQEINECTDKLSRVTRLCDIQIQQVELMLEYGKCQINLFKGLVTLMRFPVASITTK